MSSTDKSMAGCFNSIAPGVTAAASSLAAISAVWSTGF